MKTYEAPKNIVKKLALLNSDLEQGLSAPDRISTLHELAAESLRGPILLVSWFFDQAVDFIPIQLEGALMKNGYYAATITNNLRLSHGWVHGSCIVLFWKELGAGPTH